ncbi:MAG: hypothetical protein J0L61_06540 [Planctomycetes bacterium]|nr:hypothetical protein [Planctomycetota bacterium]
MPEVPVPDSQVDQRQKAPFRTRDVFPTTVAWLSNRVLEGTRGLDDANRHIMHLYAQPLKVYFLGCTLRWLGEPDDIVQGFFADRLSRPEFLSKWVASRRPLRFWLIVGFKHYLLESARALQRDRRAGPLGAADSDDVGEADPKVFDREYAVSVVREATRRAEQSCEKDGLSEHWKVFTEHHVDSRPYEEIAPRLNIDRARCAVMARTAATRFKNELRALVAWEGATEEQIDREIRSLLEVTG